MVVGSGTGGVFGLRGDRSAMQVTAEYRLPVVSGVARDFAPRPRILAEMMRLHLRSRRGKPSGVWGCFGLGWLGFGVVALQDQLTVSACDDGSAVQCRVGIDASRHAVWEQRSRVELIVRSQTVTKLPGNISGNLPYRSWNP